MKIARVFPVFTAVFAVLYLAAMYYNLALASYFPQLKRWYPLTVTNLPPSAGPGMYWYGWLATAFLGASLVAAVALALPARNVARFSATASWAAPIAAALVLVYILRGWFLH